MTTAPMPPRNQQCHSTTTTSTTVAAAVAAASTTTTTTTRPPQWVANTPGSASPKQSEAGEAQHSPTGVSARRLKKREIDRRCQRQARERTKSRIAYLEGLVENLKQADSDDRSAALMRRIEETEKERDALSQALRDVQKAVSGYRPMHEKVEPDEESPVLKYIRQARHDESDGSGAFPCGTTTSSNAPSRSAEQIPEMAMMPMSLSTPTLSMQPPISLPLRTTTSLSVPVAVPVPVPVPLMTPSSEGAIIPPCNDNCDCCREDRGKPPSQVSNHWRYLCTALVQTIESLAVAIPPNEDLLADDIAIRAVLEGWDAVEHQIGLTASWSFLRKVDERIFSACSPVTRFAALLTMYQLLQYHIDPSPERYTKIPTWYLPRPSCLTQKHSFGTNYFIWPGLRERFVFYQHQYCGNSFFKLLTDCLCLNWPYDLRDCFVQRWDSGIFVTSPLFRECIGNIYNWQMTSDFFVRYPELRSDIPCALYTPRPVSNPVQLQLGNWDPHQLDRPKKVGQQQQQQQPDRRYSAPDASLWEVQTAPHYPLYVSDQATVTVPGMAPTWIL